MFLLFDLNMNKQCIWCKARGNVTEYLHKTNGLCYLLVNTKSKDIWRVLHYAVPKKKKNAFQKAFYKINTKEVVMNVIKFHGWYSSTKKLQSSNWLENFEYLQMAKYSAY